MSYRNPRFCWRHLLREAPANYSPSSSPVQAATPKERLWDDQAGRLVEFTSSLNRQHIIDLRTSDEAVDQVDVSRILIPAGHSLANNHQLGTRASAIGDLTDPIDIVSVDGKTNLFVVPWSGLIDLEFVSGNDSPGFTLIHYAGATSENAKVGEIWATQTRQPATGVAHEWEDAQEPNLSTTETRSGNTYVNEIGSPRRIFTLEHRALSGADADLYDELLAAVGYGVNPFWYEHPDSGQAVEAVMDMGSTSGWTPIGASLATVAGSDDAVNGALEVTSTAGIAASIQKTLSGAEKKYFRNRVLSIDTKLGGGTGWIVDDDSLRLLLKTDAQHAVVDGQSSFSVSRGLRGTVFGNFWGRSFFDLEDGTSAAYEAGPIGAVGRAADLGDVDTMAFVMEFDTIDQKLVLDELNLTRKDRMPKLVELLGYERTQDSPAPLAGPTYRVRLRMREVLS